MCTMKEEDKHINNGRQEDRLSSLPDTLLITILSLLRIDSAAATSVLSHRWRYLWTHITNLSLLFPEKPNFDNLNYFVTTVEHILCQIQSSKIHTFKLSFYGRLSCNATLDFSGSMVPWIRQICRRNPEVIEVSFCSASQNSKIQMPNCVFKTASLVDIIMCYNIQMPNCDGISFINLPNLKKLDLYLYDSHRYLLGTLFKSLPILEDLDLSLDLTKNDHRIVISAPNLKRLFILFMKDHAPKNCRFSIDAPKLYFDTEGYFYHFVNSPSYLQEVELSLSDNDEYEYLDPIPGLINGITCVRTLRIAHNVGHLLRYLNNLDRIDMPVFRNLTHLSFRSDVDALRDKLPDCMLGKLTRLDVDDLKLIDYDCEIEWIEHTLNNASLLEDLYVTMDINGQGDPDYEQKEFNFCKNFFRRSWNCRIEFSGQMIKASSSNLRNGRLTCEMLLFDIPLSTFL
ncbi:F-box/LRR-repeat protein At4g14103-like [Spinacia oleracea]|uniref:F-box/LRR-repeat protein At4g14103-like n=1 Tax=Spinacia oleracea TaxID=3562 RepID=A0ABM3REH0_SPIOL|nr:F-box/LRR-repeat protein At4g14103-like [Spinacia oleracea]